MVRALDDLNFAIRLSPKDPAAYTSRGKAHMEIGDYDAAVADFGQAIQLDRGNAEHWCDRGNAKAMKNNYDGALADLDQALKLAPEDSANYFTRGFVYSRKGDFDKAMADFDQALRREPHYAEVFRDAAACWPPRGSSTRRSPISTNPSNSMPTTRRPGSAVEPPAC